MRWVFDLDGTLANVRGMDYEGAQPNWPAIEEVKRLWLAGHEISIDTARGFSGSTDRRARIEATTRKQLAKWGLRENDGYDRLRVGVKLPADRYIDDRATAASDWYGEIGVTT